MMAVEPCFPSMKERVLPRPQAGQGAGAEAGGSNLDQPVHSIPVSRAARMLPWPVEAEPRWRAALPMPSR